MKELEKALEQFPRASIATVSGRFYTMDRDKRWERIETAYKTIALGEGESHASASEYIQSSYDKDITDEFLEQAVIAQHPVQDGDAVLFWNFRADRMREIVRVLCLQDFSEFSRPAPLFSKNKTLCFCEYEESFGLPVLFHPQDIQNYLGAVVAAAGKTQLRVAETEKYPHVTYFLNGGKEEECEGESRKLIPSPRDVKTYDEKPEMSALAVKDVVVDAIHSQDFDLIVVNFANCDMVGHTGDLDAAIKAVETVDTCLGAILEELQKTQGQMLVIADHGNADQMVNYETGAAHTAHTTYPVPVVLVGGPEAVQLRDNAALCDVAPTLLKLMGIAQPKEMTGESLF